MNDSSDRVILITGGARRIGAGTARYLHSQGMHVIIHYNRSVSEAKLLEQELCRIRPESASIIQADLRDVSSLEEMLRAAIDQAGRLDGLINNASAFFPTPLASCSEQEWDELMDVNLKAPYFLSRAAAPFLEKTKGTIINIIDIYAQHPLLHYAAYCASKAGLASITRSLAQELGPDVRVNAIAPGAILWPKNNDDLDARRQLIARTPLKRIGDPQDIARTAHFLISCSDFITGQTINVDGGRANAFLDPCSI